MNYYTDVLLKLHTDNKVPKASQKFELFKVLNDPISIDEIQKELKSLKYNEFPATRDKI